MFATGRRAHEADDRRGIKQPAWKTYAPDEREGEQTYDIPKSLDNLLNEPSWFQVSHALLGRHPPSVVLVEEVVYREDAGGDGGDQGRGGRSKFTKAGKLAEGTRPIHAPVGQQDRGRDPSVTKHRDNRDTKPDNRKPTDGKNIAGDASISEKGAKNSAPKQKEKRGAASTNRDDSKAGGKGADKAGGGLTDGKGAVKACKAGDKSVKPGGQDQAQSAAAGGQSPAVLRRLELEADGFFQFLFSDRWAEGTLLRVLKGRLLDSILQALMRLEEFHDIISYATMAYLYSRRSLLPCITKKNSGNSQVEPHLVMEKVLVELDCFCPQERPLKVTQLLLPSPPDTSPFQLPDDFDVAQLGFVVDTQSSAGSGEDMTGISTLSSYVPDFAFTPESSSGSVDSVPGADGSPSRKTSERKRRYVDAEGSGLQTRNRTWTSIGRAVTDTVLTEVEDEDGRIICQLTRREPGADGSPSRKTSDRKQRYIDAEGSVEIDDGQGRHRGRKKTANDAEGSGKIDDGQGRRRSLKKTANDAEGSGKIDDGQRRRRSLKKTASDAEDSGEIDDGQGRRRSRKKTASDAEGSDEIDDGQGRRRSRKKTARDAEDSGEIDDGQGRRRSRKKIVSDAEGSDEIDDGQGRRRIRKKTASDAEDSGEIDDGQGHRRIRKKTVSDAEGSDEIDDGQGRRRIRKKTARDAEDSGEIDDGQGRRRIRKKTSNDAEDSGEIDDGQGRRRIRKKTANDAEDSGEIDDGQGRRRSRLKTTSDAEDGGEIDDGQGHRRSRKKTASDAKGSILQTRNTSWSSIGRALADAVLTEVEDEDGRIIYPFTSRLPGADGSPSQKTGKRKMRFVDAEGSGEIDDGQGRRRSRKKTASDAEDSGEIDDGQGRRRSRKKTASDAEDSGKIDDGQGRRRSLKKTANDAEGSGKIDDGQGRRRIRKKTANDAEDSREIDDGQGRRRSRLKTTSDAEDGGEIDDGQGHRRSRKKTASDAKGSILQTRNRSWSSIGRALADAVLTEVEEEDGRIINPFTSRLPGADGSPSQKTGKRKMRFVDAEGSGKIDDGQGRRRSRKKTASDAEDSGEIDDGQGRRRSRKKTASDAEDSGKIDDGQGRRRSLKKTANDAEGSGKIDDGQGRRRSLKKTANDAEGSGKIDDGQRRRRSRKKTASDAEDSGEIDDGQGRRRSRKKTASDAENSDEIDDGQGRRRSRKKTASDAEDSGEIDDRQGRRSRKKTANDAEDSGEIDDRQGRRSRKKTANDAEDSGKIDDGQGRRRSLKKTANDAEGSGKIDDGQRRRRSLKKTASDAEDSGEIDDGQRRRRSRLKTASDVEDSGEIDDGQGRRRIRKKTANDAEDSGEIDDGQRRRRSRLKTASDVEDSGEIDDGQGRRRIRKKTANDAEDSGEIDDGQRRRRSRLKTASDAEDGGEIDDGQGRRRIRKKTTSDAESSGEIDDGQGRRRSRKTTASDAENSGEIDDGQGRRRNRLKTARVAEDSGEIDDGQGRRISRRITASSSEDNGLSTSFVGDFPNRKTSQQEGSVDAQGAQETGVDAQETGDGDADTNADGDDGNNTQEETSIPIPRGMICNIRGIVKPPPHTGCFRPNEYHMLREPFLLRRHRNQSAFPTIFMPQPHDTALPSDSRSIGSLLEEETYLGPKLEDCTEVALSDTQLNPIIFSESKLLASNKSRRSIFCKEMAQEYKLERKRLAAEMKKEKRKATESTDLQHSSEEDKEEVYDEVKEIPPEICARQQKFSKDLGLIDVDLVAKAAPFKTRKVGIKTRLKTQLRMKKADLLYESTDNEEEEEEEKKTDMRVNKEEPLLIPNRLDLHKKTKRKKISNWSMNKWPRCPTFKEFYHYLAGDPAIASWLQEFSCRPDDETVEEDHLPSNQDDRVKKENQEKTKKKIKIADQSDLSKQGKRLGKPSKAGKKNEEKRSVRRPKEGGRDDSSSEEEWSDEDEDEQEKTDKGLSKQGKRLGKPSKAGKKNEKRSVRRPKKGGRDDSSSEEEWSDEDEDEQEKTDKGLSKQGKRLGKPSKAGKENEEKRSARRPKKGGRDDSSTEEEWNDEDEGKREKTDKGRRKRGQKGPRGKSSDQPSKWQGSDDEKERHRKKGKGQQKGGKGGTESDSSGVEITDGNRNRRESPTGKEGRQGPVTARQKKDRTLPPIDPKLSKFERMKRLAKIGVTPKGIHLLTAEQEELMQNEFIMSSFDPWHISVRFAYLAGGVCDSIGVRNDLLRRRERIVVPYEKAKEILEKNEARLWAFMKRVSFQEFVIKDPHGEAQEKAGKSTEPRKSCLKTKPKKKLTVQLQQSGKHGPRPVGRSGRSPARHSDRDDHGDLQADSLMRKEKQEDKETRRKDNKQTRGHKLETGKNSEPDSSLKKKTDKKMGKKTDSDSSSIKKTGKKTDSDSSSIKKTGKKTDSDSSSIKKTGKKTDSDSSSIKKTGKKTDSDSSSIKKTGKKTDSDSSSIKKTGKKTDSDSSLIKKTGKKTDSDSPFIQQSSKNADSGSPSKWKKVEKTNKSKPESVGKRKTDKRGDQEKSGFGDKVLTEETKKGSSVGKGPKAGEKKGKRKSKAKEELFANIKIDMVKYRAEKKAKREADRFRPRKETFSHLNLTDSDIPDDIKEEELLRLMKVNKNFDPTKLKSSYSFEKMFAHRQQDIRNYRTLLTAFEKPFGKKRLRKSPPRVRKAPKKVVIAVMEKEEEERKAEPSPPPFQLGKLRDYKFLQYRNYVKSQPAMPALQPCAEMGIDEICQHLLVAMQRFVVRKERATVLYGSNQCKSKVTVTFTRRVPGDVWVGVPPMVDSARTVAAVCKTLKAQ